MPNMETAYRLLATYLDADVPVMLSGGPGIGKSDVTRQGTRAFLSRMLPNLGDGWAARTDWGLIDLRASLLDPVDVRGLPQAHGDMVRWLVPVFLPNVERDGPVGVLFLDELTNAPLSVQAALYQLVLDRRVGEYTLPSGWRIVAAGNRTKDKAAAQRMSSALANRFAHIECEPDPNAWQAWAAPAGVNPLVRAFIRFRPEMLHVMPSDQDARAFPSPRSWTQAAKVATAPEGDRLHLVSGLVGEHAAAEFEAFARLYSRLPPIPVILANPDSAPVPVDVSTQWAVATALAHVADRANLGAVITYADRLPREYGVVAVTDAVARDRSLAETAAFAQWAVRNADIHV